MVKRPRGLAVLVSPCWRPGIWPLFEDQSCNFLFLLSLWRFRRLGLMNKTKTIFIITLLYAHPFMPYFFIIKWAHVHTPLFHPNSTFTIIALFFSCKAVLVYWYTPFASFLPSLISLLAFLSAVLCSLRCCDLCDRLLLTHSTSAAPQMRAGRAKGRTWCRAQGAGFNEACLNEFTAFHWATLSHVMDQHLSHCVTVAPSALLPVCLTLL